jgi:hypothetical protein
MPNGDILKHLSDLGTALSLYAVMAVSYFGWGSFGCRLLKLYSLPVRSPFLTIWFGWAFSLFLLQAVHFVSPVDYRWHASFVTGAAFSISTLRSYFANSQGQ